MRKWVLVAAALATAALLTAGAASASATGTVSVVGCVFLHGGQETVPAGSAVSFRFGWGARSAGLDGVFLQDETTTASVDGNPVANADSYWGAIAPSPGGGYLTTWLYPTGVTLAAGESLTLTMDVVLAHPLTDGYSGRIPAGSLFGGPVTCTVTGV